MLSHNFLDYLHTENLLTTEQIKKINSAPKVYKPNYDFLCFFFFNLSIEQIQQVKERFYASMTQTFLGVIEELGFADEYQCQQFLVHHQANDFVDAQIICNFSFMDKRMLADTLLLYLTNHTFEENVVHLPENIEELIPVFVESYAQTVLVRLKNYFDTSATYDGCSTPPQLPSRLLVYQQLVSEACTFLLGICTNLETVSHLVKIFCYEDKSREVVRLSFDTEAEQIDFLCEILNNINGVCTGKYSIVFDLELAQPLENVMLTSNAIYKLDYTVHSEPISFFVISGKEYTFENYNFG